MMELSALPVLPLPNGLKLALQSPRQEGCTKYIIKEIFRDQSYLRPGFELRPTDTVVDIGGNVGVFALWAAKQVKRVVSVEPTSSIDCLEKSLELNEITNVSIVRCAVSDATGTIELLQYPGFSGVTHAASFRPAKWGQRLIKLLWRKDQVEPVKVKCPCMSLAGILESSGIDRVDFLKVDCEGGEYAVFDAISDETLARISRIALEFHEIHPSHNHRRIVRRLRSAGFHVKIERSLQDRYLLQAGMLWAIRKD